jgi:hypothetical protein
MMVAKPTLRLALKTCALERLQEDIMQTNLERGKAASGARCAGRVAAILASVPLIAVLGLAAPDRALAGACGTSHPAGVHAGTTSGIHNPTSTVKTGSAGGGGGSLGCANGSSSTAALNSLATSTSGKVVEGRAHPVAHAATHTKTAATRTANTSSAHSRAVKAHP